jgi:Glycosyltransferase Family 4
MLLKKVLLITYHFPPSAASGSFRLLGFTRHLPVHGWQPLVVAPPQLPWEPIDSCLAEDVPIDAVVHHVPYPSGAPKLLRYFAQNAVWLPRAWFACKRMIEVYRPDVILTSGPPHCVHVLGHHLKRRYGVPWFADFRDPWISEGTDKRLSFMQRWERRWEQRVFQNADRVLANAPNACRMFQATYPLERDKIFTLTNGFDPRSSKTLLEQDSCIRLLHAGELYYGRDPLPLFEALAKLNADPAARRPFELEILGRCDPGGVDYQQWLQQRGWSSFVKMRGQQAYQNTLDALDRAGILVLFDSPGRKIGVPAKLYEYFGARRGRCQRIASERRFASNCVTHESR